MNLPYDEALARQIINALKAYGFSFFERFDPVRMPLDRMLCPPGDPSDLSLAGVLDITKGPGKHEINTTATGKHTYNVAEKEVYATLDTTNDIYGSISTYVLFVVGDRLVFDRWIRY